MSFFRRSGAEILRVISLAADPTAETSRNLLYAKDASAVTQLFGRSSDGFVWQLTPSGQLAVYNVGGPGATNFEVGTARWTSNVFIIGPQQGGTGTARAVQLLHGDATGLAATGNGGVTIIGSSGGNATLGANSETIALAVYGKVTTSTSVSNVAIFNNTGGTPFSAAANTQRLCRMFGTVNQSGSAAFNGCEVDVTVTSVGSGAVYGLQIRRAGVAVFGIDVKATLTADADTVMFLTYFSGGALKHARVTLGVDVAGQRALQVAT